MAKRSPRLIFTEEERALPELERVVRKADRAAVKLEKAEAKIPKKTVKVKKRVVDSESGKVTTRLFFEEADKKRPPSKLAHAARKAPLDTVRSAVHRKLREEGGDNPGTEAANTLTETAERTWRIAESAHRSHAEKPYRRADRAEAAADKANLKALNKQYEQEYGRASNPYSRWQQKQAIKKEYAAAKAGNGARNTVKASETTAKAAKRAAEGSKELGSFFVRHKKGFLIAGGVAAAILLLMTCISSCSTLFQGGASGIAASTYPLEDADMLAAEAAYADGGRGAAADHRQLQGLDGLSHHRRKAVQIPLRRAGHDPRPASGRHRLRGVRLLERKDGPVCPQGLQGHRPHRQQRRKAEASVCVRRVGYGRQRVSKEPLPVGIPG